MHRAAKNMFKCYRSTVPSGPAAFQIQSRDIRERDTAGYLISGIYYIYFQGIKDLI